jgi:hypothetical protein
MVGCYAGRASETLAVMGFGEVRAKGSDDYPMADGLERQTATSSWKNH